MHTFPSAAAAVTAVLSLGVAGCSSPPEGWPEPYPSAGTTAAAVAANEAGIAVTVTAPSTLVTGLPAPMSVTVTSAKPTVVVPRLQLSYIGADSATPPDADWFAVSTAAGPVTGARPISPPPGVGLKWSWSGQALEYTLPAITVDGSATVELKVVANNPAGAAGGTVVAATAADAVSPTVVVGAAHTGTPTAASTGLREARMLQLPEPNRDPLPTAATATDPPVPGGSADTWVPLPHAETVPRTNAPQPPVVDLVSGMTPAQVSSLQTSPTAPGGEGLSTGDCALTAGNCTFSFQVVTVGDALLATTAVQVGVNMDAYGANVLAAELGAPTATVNGSPVAATRAGNSAWSYTIPSEQFREGGSHTVEVSIPGTARPYPSDFAVFIDQLTEQGRWPGRVGVSLADGTITDYTLAPGQLTGQQQAQAQSLPLGPDGTYQPR